MRDNQLGRAKSIGVTLSLSPWCSFVIFRLAGLDDSTLCLNHSCSNHLLWVSQERSHRQRTADVRIGKNILDCYQPEEAISLDLAARKFGDSIDDAFCVMGLSTGVMGLVQFHLSREDGWDLVKDEARWFLANNNRMR